MTDQEAETIGLKALALEPRALRGPGVRWWQGSCPGPARPGRLDVAGAWAGEGGQGFVVAPLVTGWPDVRDPATQGILLGLLMAAGEVMVLWDNGAHVVKVLKSGIGWTLVQAKGEHYGAALVDVLGLVRACDKPALCTCKHWPQGRSDGCPVHGPLLP